MATVLLATPDGVLLFPDGTATPTHELAGRRVRALARQRDSWLAIADDTE